MSLIVLIYHKLVDSNDEAKGDPLKITVSTQTFRDQLEALTAHFTLVDLASVLQAPACFAGPSGRFISVTFDDGYWPSLEAASSVLTEHCLPATCFISPGHVDDGRPYWWDILTSYYRLGHDALGALGNLNAAAGALTQLPYRESWARLEMEIGPSLVTHLTADQAQRPASWDQLRSLQGHGISFGLHGYYHDAFRALGPELVRNNLAIARRRALEEGLLLLDALAYPFGDSESVDPNALRNVLETFSWGFMAERGVVFAGGDQDHLSLPRFHVTQGDVDRLMIRLEALFCTS